MKRLLSIALITLAAMSAASCAPEEKQESSGADINANFDFTLRVSEVGYDYAKINVQHNGPEDATWYGFLTENTGKTDISLISEKYAELFEKGEISGLRNTKNRTITLDELEATTKYKYVVFAISEDLQLYNNVDAESVTFTTGANPYVLTLTEDWTVSRKAERMDNQEVISIESASSSLYVWDYVTKEFVDNFNQMYPEGLDIIIDDQYMATLDAFQTYIINQIGTIQYWVIEQKESIRNYTYEYDGTNAENNVYTMPRLASGDYYFLAFGMNSDGSHTQTYSVSDLITIEEEASTPEYEAWFGTYEFSGKALWIFEDDEETGMKEGDEKDMRYNITIEQLDNNFLYLIKGWECGPDVNMDIEEEVWEVDKEDGGYIGFIGYYNDGKLEFRETTVTTFSEGESTIGFGMCGYAYNETSEAYSPVILEETPMAEALPFETGSDVTTMNGLEFSFPTETGTLDLKYEMMGYVFYDYYSLMPASIFNMPMKFPITITKGEETPADTDMAVKQGFLRKMKTGPVSIEADRRTRPMTYGRR